MLSSKTASMFKQAIREAQKSDCNYRLGSVVIKQRKILGRACNEYRTHPLTNTDPAFLKGLHAEIGACLNAPRSQLEGADVFVARILKNGSLALSRPCEICQSVLSRFRVQRVYYSIAENEYGVIVL